MQGVCRAQSCRFTLIEHGADGADDGKILGHRAARAQHGGARGSRAVGLNDVGMPQSSRRTRRRVGRQWRSAMAITGGEAEEHSENTGYEQPESVSGSWRHFEIPNCPRYEALRCIALVIFSANRGV